MTFRDVEGNVKVGEPREITSDMRLGETHASDLSDFLSRPVLLATLSWAVGGSILSDLDPFQLYMVANQAVVNRLVNYAYVKADMHVKVVVNSNGFYAGRAVAGWQPQDSRDDVWINTTDTASLSPTLVALSQLKHIYIDLATAQGGEMIIPGIVSNNWLSRIAGDTSTVGLLRTRTMVAATHANGGTDPVIVSIFGWLENVSLSSPTTFQSEYGKGLVSSRASAVARVADALASFPVIGPYARATEMAASMAAGVGRALGYSRPPILDPPKLVRNAAFGNLCNTDADECVVKLSLDSKQELTVDPRVVGLPGMDELAIGPLIARESYYGSFNWSTSQTAGTLLAEINVQPVTSWASTANSGGVLHAMSPSSMVSQLFQYWSGTMKYRFSIVGSEYHRGRIRISYDPNFFSTAYPTWNTVFSQVVDISEQRDFEICVGWAQPSAYLPIVSARTFNSATGFYGLRSTRSTVRLPGSNGCLDIEVLNDLTQPGNASPTVTILVFASAGEDMSFIGPTDVNICNTSLSGWSHLNGTNALQSLETTVAGESVPCSEISMVEDKGPDFSLVYAGEKVISLRTMLKRYWLYRADSQTTTNTSQWSDVMFTYQNFPPQRGPYASTSYAYDVTGAAAGYVYANMTPLHWIAPCFLTRRGAIRWKYAAKDNSLSDPTGGSTSVTRFPSAVNSGGTRLIQSVQDSTPSKTAYRVSNYARGTGNGTAIVSTSLQQVVEVELPYYSTERFSYSRLMNPYGSVLDSSTTMNHTVTFTVVAAGQTVKLDAYVSIGEDFNLAGFLYAPCMYYRGDPVA